LHRLFVVPVVVVVRLFGGIVDIIVDKKVVFVVIIVEDVIDGVID
jgi:hypothetical protein